MAQGAGAGAVAEVLRSPAAGAPTPRPGRLLGSAPRTGGGDSERPSTAASSTQAKETPPAAHSASIKVSAKDSSEKRPAKESPGSPAAATPASAALNHPLYCLY